MFENTNALDICRDALENIQCNLTGRDYMAERIKDSLRRATEALAHISKLQTENDLLPRNDK